MHEDFTLTARRGIETIFVGPILLNQTILECLKDAGFKIPSSCTSGTCGTCMMSLISGEIASSDEEFAGLDDDELPDEAILSCQAQPNSDLIVDIRAPL